MRRLDQGSSSSRRGRGRRRAGKWLLGLLLLWGAQACSFERRAEPDAEPAEGNGGLPSPSAELPGAETRVAPLETVELFRASVAIGDISLALALLDREATLVDELVGEASEAQTRGELLLELRRQHASGLVFEPLEAPTVVTLSESALVITHFAAVREGEGGARQEVGQVYETVFLLASPDGWRIRHMHRSLLSAR
ncbi:MAG: hypothetical protein EXR92_02365 [Gemmatimonadetes bacterium]|nr:hypothetical protein [Gemmatimonadota bacterium]